ncbi:MAG TPA: hypothetical protein VGL13_14000 [Polyangiaceae bacterium]
MSERKRQDARSSPSPTGDPRASLPRRAALVVILCGGAAVFLATTGRHYSPADWLIWRYGAYLLMAGAWSLSLFAAGSRIYRWLEPRPLPLLERAAISFALGLFAFFLAMFAGGLAGWLGSAFAIVLWATLLAFGWRELRTTWRHVAIRVGRIRLARKGSDIVIVLAVSAAVAMVYFSILSPENPGFDTRWYHLPIAEQYAAQGSIRPFAEGWYYGAYPHLASVVYAFAFLVPGARLFDRVCLSAHLELVVFLWTLLATAALSARLVPRGPVGAGRHLGLGLAATFLFPGIFLYDGGLFTGADHFLAFFCAVVPLCWFRLAEDPSLKRAALFGVMVGALVVTKYQAAWVLPLPLLAIAVILLRRRAVAELGLAAMVALACAAPHWLKNWIGYGDPVFPLAAAWFHPHPWSPSAARLLEQVYARGIWPAQGTLSEKLADTARVLFTFSFEPHDWPTYHGEVPVFGSLFTLLLFALPLLRVRRRLWWVVAFTFASVAGWFLVSHQDRYLQAVLPWMAAVTAATMLQLAKEGRWVKTALFALVGLQVAWGSGVYFIHARDAHYEIDRPSPLAAAVELLAAGYEGTLERKLSPYEPWPSIGRALPAGARPLVHERYLRLGLGAPSVTDLPGSQSAIDYTELATPTAIYDRLASLGVTHVVWESKTSHGNDTVAGDLAFFRFVEAAAVDRREVQGFTVARMVAPAASSANGAVLSVDCGSPERSGMLTLETMFPVGSSWEPDALAVASPVGSVDDAAGKVELLSIRSPERRCFQPSARDGWAEVARRKGYSLWVRGRAPIAEGAPPG